jgi:hypothetical protein
VVLKQQMEGTPQSAHLATGLLKTIIIKKRGTEKNGSGGVSICPGKA